ncbi:MAG: ATPase, T2SS/T4P/T4SS family [Planctomycetota bacterium]
MISPDTFHAATATHGDLLVAASSRILVNPAQPLIALGFLFAVGWLISTVLDKDARYWHFKANQWSMAHLIALFAGFAVAVLPLVPEWWWSLISLPLGLLVMLSTPIAYWIYRNSNVPEDKKFRLTAEAIRASMSQRKDRRAAANAMISVFDHKEAPRQIPDREDPRYAVHMAMEGLLSPAFVARATNLELVPGRSGAYSVSQTVDSVRYRRDPVAAADAGAVIDYMKDLAGLDVQDRRRKQRGDFTAKMGVETFVLRTRTEGASAGQRAVLDINPAEQVKKKFDQLGFHPRQVEALNAVTADLHGIVLVAAPPDIGTKATLYGLIRRHDAFTSNIRTLELERLLQIEGVGHTEWNPNATPPVDYATQLRSMLRRDPDIMVSEMVDVATAKEAAYPGPSGPLQYIGVAANRAMDAVMLWCKAVGDMPKAAAPLKAAVGGRVLRVLCDECRVPYQPNPDQLKKIGLPPDQVKQLFRPSGKLIIKNREEPCPACNGIGYRGTTGVYELMAFDDEARKLIEKSDFNGLFTHLRRNKMMTLQEAALRKAIEGVTSIEEVMRVTQPPAQKKPGGGSKKGGGDKKPAAEAAPAAASS